MPSSGMLHSVAPVRTKVSEEHRASIIRVTRIGELGTLAVASVSQEQSDVTSQKTTLFIVTAVKTSNLT
jgi:hypothetical protein